MLQLTFLLIAWLAGSDAAYFGTYHCTEGKDVIVHMFEWKWSSIQAECPWLAANGFCAVQVSPPSEHIVKIESVIKHPWWERYQPISYRLYSRSGSAVQFADMVRACNNVGVWIYVDAVINHMSGGGEGTGSGGSYGNTAGGSWWSGDNEDYPGVPYSDLDFNHYPNECPNPTQEISNYNDATEVRNCRLVGLRDLKMGTSWVRSKIIEYMNALIDLGVAGFRIDASKHMWPGDCQFIFDSLSTLKTTWFPQGTRAFIFQEVIDLGGEGISYSQYTGIGRVTEFRYSASIGEVVRRSNGQQMSYLNNFGEGWGFMSGIDAVVFIDNHDNQRGHGAGGDSVLTHKDPRMYKIATAFELAWSYGYPRIMSSYEWGSTDWQGPPSDGNGNTNDVTCFSGGWYCEYKWRQITNMVKFHNAVVGTQVQNWWDNGGHMIAFSRGSTGFIVINNDASTNMDIWLTTGLPAGEYCDIITCDNVRPVGGNCGNSDGSCRGIITVAGDSRANFNIPASHDDPVIAIRV